jgi:starch-binding outer membrane protein SusE/F
MKRLINIFSIIAGFIFLYACVQDTENPVVDLSAIRPPQLTSPQAGGQYVLGPDEDDEVIFRTSWTATDFNTPRLPDPSYAIEIDRAGNNFANPATIATVEELEFDVTSNRLNTALGVLELTPNVPAEVSMRIRAFIPGAAGSLNSYSEAINFTATPFVLVVKPIYLLGNGTLAGWNNNAALEMRHVERSIFEIETTLSGGANNFLKFISVRGQWAPQWGTDQSPPTVNNGVISGNLVYRQTEAVPDPPAIPVPMEAGTYVVRADTAALTYTITPVATKMYLTGEALNDSKDEVIEMEKDASGVFSAIINLDGLKGRSFQFTPYPEVYAVRFGSVSDQVTLTNEIDYSHGTFVNLPAEKGDFKIEYDPYAHAYKIMKL